MPGTVVTFEEIDIKRGFNLLATFQAEIEFYGPDLWLVYDVKLQKTAKTMSEMPMWESLDKLDPLFPILQDWVSTHGRATVNAEIAEEVSWSGGWREMGRMAAE